LFVERPRAIEEQWHQAARRPVIRGQQTWILENQPECDLSVLIAQQARMICNVEELSKMVFLGQLRQAILRPDFFD
jgi:hypothetical protein